MSLTRPTITRALRKSCKVLIFAFLSVMMLTLPSTSAAQAQDSSDDARVVAVGQAVSALEAYGSANLTYRVAGGGWQGAGTGWYDFSNGGTIPDSVYNVLLAEGYFAAIDPVFDLDAAGLEPLRLQHCGDRVGVFSFSDGIEASAEDAQWWADNNCSRNPIDARNRPYFQLSEPVATEPELTVTLPGAWFGDISDNGGQVSVDWEPIAGATDYDVAWTVDYELQPLETDIASPASTFTVPAGPHRVCASIRGLNATERSPWSPETCLDVGSTIVPAAIGEAVVADGQLSVNWTPGTGDRSDVAVYVEGERQDIAAPDGATSVSLPVSDTANVCVGVTDYDAVTSEMSGNCFHVRNGELLDLVRSEDPLPTLPTNADGSLQFNDDGSVVGSFTPEQVQSYNCTALPEPILRPGDEMRGGGNTRKVQFYGYTWQPDGWRVSASGGVDTRDIGIGRNGTAWFFFPFATGAFYEDRTTSETIEVTDYHSGRYSIYNPFVWVEVGTIGDWVPVLFNHRITNDWDLTWFARLQPLRQDGIYRPPAPEPCTVFSDISNFIVERPSGIDFIVDHLRDRLEAACGVGDDAGNLELLSACADALAEFFMQFVPGYDCFNAIKSIVNGDAPSVADVGFCLLDGLGPALDALRAAGNINVVARNADGDAIGSITIDGAHLADELLAQTDEAVEAVTTTACRANSFISSTPVLMADGSLKTIGEITVGDSVKSWNEATNTVGSSIVSDLIVGEGQKRLVEVSLSTGKVVATSEHPFWSSTRRAWVDASQLTVGERLIDANQEPVLVVGIDYQTARRATVHNLTIDGTETYYVSAGASVLVHNCRVDELTGRAADYDADTLAGFVDIHNADVPNRPSFDEVRSALNGEGAFAMISPIKTRLSSSPMEG